jgi:AbrB family looped-hinge helix DNA binding protein
MQTYGNLVKILPKGLVTIPKKLRQDIGLEENSLARIKKEGNRLILEPVNIISYPLRDYSVAEINKFIKEDRLSPQLARKAKKLLK